MSNLKSNLKINGNNNSNNNQIKLKELLDEVVNLNEIITKPKAFVAKLKDITYKTLMNQYIARSLDKDITPDEKAKKRNKDFSARWSSDSTMIITKKDSFNKWKQHLAKVYGDNIKIRVDFTNKQYPEVEVVDKKVLDNFKKINNYVQKDYDEWMKKRMQKWKTHR